MVNHNGYENARSDWSIPHLLFPMWEYNGEASARLNYDSAPKSAQVDQWPSEAANCTPEVAFSPFRALFRRQLTFPFCC